jgi:hypothetical protein
MSISTYRKLLNEITASNDRIMIAKIFQAINQSQSSWIGTIAPVAGVAPTTPVVPTNATVGSLGQQNGGAAALRIPGMDLMYNGGQLWICDRLSHQAGLDATVTTAQTTNLPTAALTRYTSGTGVLMTLEIYTQIGATGTTVSASYTNQAGTAGQTSPLVTFGGTNFREIQRVFVLPFQSGDTGVRSVESVTVTATTGTAGNFGVTLVYPLVPFTSVVLQPFQSQSNGYVYLGGFLPEILDNACLYLINHPSVASGAITGDIHFAEDT